LRRNNDRAKNRYRGARLIPAVNYPAEPPPRITIFFRGWSGDGLLECSLDIQNSLTNWIRQW
jgi:hypothetical protein